LATSHAFHSPLMEPMLEEFERRVAQVDTRAPRIPFASNVTGRWITAEQATSASYWAEHVRSAVRFSDDVTLLLRDEPEALLLEVGPGGAAAALVSGHEVAQDRIVVASMRHVRDPRGDVRLTREAMARLWVNGVPIDWAALHTNRSPRRVPLPTYAFDTKRYWIEAPGRPTVDPSPTPTETVAAPALAAKGYARPVLSSTYVAPRSLTEERVVAELEETLGVHPIGVHDNFFEIGGNSLLAMRIVGRSEARLGARLSSHVVLDAPTAAQLAHLVDAALTPSSGAGETALVPLKQGEGDGVPLFLVHPVGGSVFFYRELARLLPAEQAVYGFQARGLDGAAAPLRSIEEMASHYCAELRAQRPTGPYALGGASFGGLVALEMAQLLRAAGETVHLLAVFDSPAPGQMPPDREEMDTAAFGSGDPDASFAQRVVDVYRANMEALRAYRPRPYEGPILYFLAEERRAGIDPLRPDTAWEPIALDGLSTHRVPGNHVTMLAPENVEAIARVVSAHLPSFE
ncbi:alpha/beta fold hydrolase, partial [Streptomyces sp. AB3(2024)]|uniref:alpha/beta fold hydrolase n=1 Tax=Streptomyces sp. AB3(2024) TaxID=3317321 RepID=UPI0035A2972A